jgi:chromosome segregation ATPase
MEFNDKENRKMLEKEIEKISEEYNDLKSQQEYLKNRLNSLESEAQFALNENDRYYYESEKQTPRAPFNGVIG